MPQQFRRFLLNNQHFTNTKKTDSGEKCRNESGECGKIPHSPDFKLIFYLILIELIV